MIAQLINQSMSDGGDCRTAPATTGLLNTGHEIIVPLLVKEAWLHGVCQIKVQLDDPWKLSIQIYVP